MIFVVGIAGSGAEALMAFTDLPLSRRGDRLGVAAALTRRADHLVVASEVVKQYEDYLSGLSPASPEQLLEDVSVVFPDGTWPGIMVPRYNHSEFVFQYADTPKVMARVAPEELFHIDPALVDRVYLVTVSPDILLLRRLSAMLRGRSLYARYADDVVYGGLASMEMTGWSPSVPSMLTDYRRMLDAADVITGRFGTRIVRLNGDLNPMPLTLDTVEYLVKNRDTTPIPGMSFPEQDTSKMEDCRRIHEAILERLAAGPAAEAAARPAFGTWICARTGIVTAFNDCRQCAQTGGEPMLKYAKPDAMSRPCAFEVAYGPEPHKSIEQSIAEHSWSVLP